MLYGAMAVANSCLILTGEIDTEIQIKSFDEIKDLSTETNNVFLQRFVFMYCIAVCFWLRDYMMLAELSEKHSEKYPSPQGNSIIHIFRVFYEGVAFLSLARDKKQVKWRELGEKAAARMAEYEARLSKWNCENKSRLLQAELHYLNGNLESAETAYKASIKAAHNHKFIHEEAMAYELYGIFCVENHMVEKGSEQLLSALDKYKEWGANKKVDELRLYIGLVCPFVTLSIDG